MSKGHAQLTEQQLEQAVRLSPDLLTVYLQSQADKRIKITQAVAIHEYHLSMEDVDQLQPTQLAPKNPKQAQSRQKRNSKYHSHQRKINFPKQAVLALSDKKWGGIEGLQLQHNSVQHAKASAKYADIARQTQARYDLEASEAGQARTVLQAQLNSQLASSCPGGSARLETLKASLAAHGLPLRADSRKCTAYIEFGVGNPDEIANVMLEMKWLFDNTNYPALVQQAKGKVHKEKVGFV